ncbi:hypothetical protein LCGC14_2870000 [marine sediment metagenome]|uniref:Uncharacterized protein n=1 Tax=marine sediment metagenome TaxID=412755 RepID=A0A0F8Y3F5_9ZZZZ
MDTYTQMVDCKEIQSQRTDTGDSRYYVKEDIWGFSDQNIEDRKSESEGIATWYSRKYPEKPPYKHEPILEAGAIEICAGMLGVEDSNDIQMTVWTVLQNYPDKFIWLPRQENIQEMLWSDFSEFSLPSAEIKLLMEFIYANKEYVFSFDGLKDGRTIIWLAFYMKEVHSKKWTEKGWV